MTLKVDWYGKGRLSGGNGEGCNGDTEGGGVKEAEEIKGKSGRALEPAVGISMSSAGSVGWRDNVDLKDNADCVGAGEGVSLR